jgi:hypothetical protein
MQRTSSETWCCIFEDRWVSLLNSQRLIARRTCLPSHIRVNFRYAFRIQATEFALSYNSFTSLTKSSTSLPPSQSFHIPSSLMHLTFPANLTVQLLVTLFSRLHSTLFLSKLIPCASSLLMQSFILSKLRLCSRAQFSTRVRSGMFG